MSLDAGLARSNPVLKFRARPVINNPFVGLFN